MPKIKLFAAVVFLISMMQWVFCVSHWWSVGSSSGVLARLLFYGTLIVWAAIAVGSGLLIIIERRSGARYAGAVLAGLVLLMSATGILLGKRYPDWAEMIAETLLVMMIGIGLTTACWGRLAKGNRGRKRGSEKGTSLIMAVRPAAATSPTTTTMTTPASSSRSTTLTARRT
jgi:hypothetical protein